MGVATGAGGGAGVRGCAGRGPPRPFYDTFGEDIANEFVEWFNLVDAAYRSELGELFDVNFGRFDAKLEQRIAELRADLRTEFERRIGLLDAKLEQRLADLRVDLRTEFERRIAALDAKLEQRVADVREGLARLEGRMVARMALSETRLIRWMFAFWAASVATSIALIQLTR
ncbi:MAG TPA: hypothetical protein VD707_04710 [Gemmatimonadales bacterium]|nr:hypothetical protein [Gemmatimonadales bacterium]